MQAIVDEKVRCFKPRGKTNLVSLISKIPFGFKNDILNTKPEFSPNEYIELIQSKSFSDNLLEINLDEYEDVFTENILIEEEEYQKILDNPKFKYLKLKNISILDDINNLLISLDVKDKLTSGEIHLKHKKGDPHVLKNFRPLVNLNTCTKFLERILLEIILPDWKSGKLMNNNIQYANRSVLTLQIKMNYELKHKKNDELHLFLDLEDAYGSINYGLLIEIMKKYHLHSNFIGYIKAFYENAHCQVIIKNQFSDKFKWSNGLFQGSVLGNFLFQLYLDFVLKYLYSKLNIQYSIEEFIHAFVDDMVLKLPYDENVSDKIGEVFNILQDFGLKVNSEKSFFHTNDNRPEISFNNKTLKQVNEEFHYLGHPLIGIFKNSLPEYINFISERIERLKEITEGYEEVQLYTFYRKAHFYIRSRLVIYLICHGETEELSDFLSLYQLLLEDIGLNNSDFANNILEDALNKANQNITPLMNISLREGKKFEKSYEHIYQGNKPQKNIVKNLLSSLKNQGYEPQQTNTDFYAQNSFFIED